MHDQLHIFDYASKYLKMRTLYMLGFQADFN